MGVGHGRSRVAELALQVTDRVIHPDWLTTRAFRRIRQGAWEADVRIVDGGHSICFRCGPIRISEVLVGSRIPLPDQGVLDRSPIRAERSLAFRPGGMADYQNCCEVERLDEEVFRHLDREITLTGPRGDLFFRFAPHNRFAPHPISRIHLEPLRRGLAVQTFHSFPDESAFVRTQSLFEPIGLESKSP